MYVRVEGEGENEDRGGEWESGGEKNEIKNKKVNSRDWESSRRHGPLTYNIRMKLINMGARNPPKKKLETRREGCQSASRERVGGREKGGAQSFKQKKRHSKAIH